MLWNILGENMLRKYVPCPEEQKQYFISTRAASLDVRMVSPTYESNPRAEICFPFYNDVGHFKNKVKRVYQTDDFLYNMHYLQGCCGLKFERRKTSSL